MEDAPAVRPLILALTDGKPGHFHQTEGILAHLPEADRETIRVTFRSKAADNWLRVQVAVGRRLIPARAARAMLNTALEPGSFDALLSVKPPNAVLSTGSSVASVNLLLGRIFGARTVVCMRPSPIGVGPFDLAILARHQWVEDDENAVRVLGVPTHVTPELVEERRRALPEPVPPTIGLLFGGNDTRYWWTADAAQEVLDVLMAVARATGRWLAVTTSRRTPPDVEALIRSRVVENPYCAYAALASDPSPKEAPVQTILAMSEWVAVTVDSFSMVCEAASSGKPVGLIRIPSARSDRYAPAFAAIAEQTGMADMPLDTLHEQALRLTQNPPQTTPLRDAATAADGIRRLLGIGAP